MYKRSGNLKKIVNFQINAQNYSNHGILPSQARVVIAGSGAVANSVAYHLSKNGWQDILILEQNKINSGTSNYGTGLIGLFKPIAMRKIIMESLNMYKDLETMGYNIGLQKCGSIGEFAQNFILPV